MANRTKWEVIDEIFLHENYGKMGMFALCRALNEIRRASEQVSLHSLRRKLRAMGLYRKQQIRWSAADTEFLNRNYRNIGDTELATMLNRRRQPFTSKAFTKKHVEKKRSLLKLVRTADEILAVKRRNIANGRHCFTSNDNLWTRGIRKKMEQGEVMRCRTGYFVKSGEKILPYARWYYHNFVAPIPDGYRAFYRDGDRFNIEHDNIIIAKSGFTKTRQHVTAALELLKNRKKQLLHDLNKGLPKGKDETYRELRQREARSHADLNRISSLIEKYRLRDTNFYLNAKQRYYLHFRLRSAGNKIKTSERTIIKRAVTLTPVENRWIMTLKNNFGYNVANDMFGY